MDDSIKFDLQIIQLNIRCPNLRREDSYFGYVTVLGGIPLKEGVIPFLEKEKGQRRGVRAATF